MADKAGSYVVEGGELKPNLNDEAMSERAGIKKKETAKTVSVVDTTERKVKKEVSNNAKG